MTNKKSTKRALLMSALALLMCVSMLIGSTFAWFTDSVVSGSNVITSGNLDVEVTYQKEAYGENGYLAGKLTNPVDLQGATDIFGNGKWEPGYTDYVIFNVSNNGSLALKFELAATILSETAGTNVYNNEFHLSDYLLTASKVSANIGSGYNDWGTMDAELGSWMARMNDTANVGMNEGVKLGSVAASDEVLLPGETKQVLMLVWMPTTVGNEANHNGTNIPEINLGVNVVATQYTNEKDSFGSDYDANAEYSTIVGSSAELKDAIAAGKTNIQLLPGEYTADLYVVPANRKLTINGSGADTKLSFSNQQVRLALFDSLTISNCTIERMATKNWGHLVFGSSETAGGVYTLSNCIFNGVGTQGIYINQNNAATFNIKNCIFNGDFGGEGAITIQNNKDVNVTVNVTDCEFNNIPATSHEIFVIYPYEGWTLNADGITAHWEMRAYPQ